MRDWVTTVKMNTNGPPTDEALDALLDALEPLHVGGLTLGTTTITTTCTVTADRVDKAVATVVKAVATVARRHDSLGEVDDVTVLPAEDRDRALEAGYGDVVGFAEVTAILGVTKQSANRLIKRRDFPTPIERLAAGPVWSTRDVMIWADNRS